MRISDWSSDVCSSDLEAFSVIRSAMESTQTVGIARLVLYRRERAVMLVPRDQGITLWTLRYGDEVRDPDDYFDAIKPEKPEAKLLSLALSLINERTERWDQNMVSDPEIGRASGRERVCKYG